MDRNAISERVRAQMPERRWAHTAGVMETAVSLAERYGADPAKAELAAILHDVAKYWKIEDQKRELIESGEAGDLLEYDPQLWHAHVGAYVARRDYGIEDQEVLDAIRWHTSGRIGMTTLEKVVCLADYMEPGREFPGVDRIREEAVRSLDRALVLGFDSTITFLLANGRPIYPLTVLARNDLIRLLDKEADNG
jgi:predicted HD superfamily hydrolase involved in NAD metabolism